MPGRLAFAWESPTWGGGIAFYQAVPDGVVPDGVVPDGAVPDGAVLARAYLVSAAQFADVLEQEMWRPPGADHDLASVVRDGRLTMGPGRYETLHLVGELDGRPVVTFTAPDIGALGLRAPADAYLVTLAQGLRESHGLAPDEIAAYLAGCAGIGRSAAELEQLLAE